MFRTHPTYKYPDDHLFCIGPYISSFLYPCKNDQCQLLILVGDDESAVIRFSLDGALLDVSSCKVTLNELAIPVKIVLFGRGQLEQAPIWVERFCIVDEYIGIQDLASWMYDFLDAPDKHCNFYGDFQEDARRAEVKHAYESINKWLVNGHYSLVWGEEFYLDKDGNVELS